MAFKLVRRNLKSGEVEARKRGRPHPEFENGYLDESGEFKAGEPRKKKGKPGRPKGSSNKTRSAKSAPKKKGKRGRPAGSGKKSAGRAGGLSEIEAIVRREVDARLRVAREAAVAALKSALGG